MVAIDIAQAGPLQAAIQKKLVEHGYSPEDDMVMAEYVTVMLANSKTSEQITTELSDLIGPEYEASFTDWIFEHAIPEHYGGGAEAEPTTAKPRPVSSSTSPSAALSDSTTAPAKSSSTQTSSIQTVGDSRESQGRGQHNNSNNNNRNTIANLPNRPPTGPRAGNNNNNNNRGGNGVFGTAMQGLKREGDRDGYDRPSRRPRTSEPGASSEQSGSGRSIFDRAGVTPGTALPNNFQNMGGRPLQNGPRRGGGGGPGFPLNGNTPNGPPPFVGPGAPVLPPLHIPDNFNSLPPAQQQAIQQQIFQHQLIAAAAAQQMFGGGPPPHMNAGAAPFAMPPQPGMAQQPFPQQPPPQHQRGPAGTSKPSTPKPVVLPKVPTSEELCKYGVDCKNATCGYSHPSPAATKDSGLVLSKEVCEKNLDCTDKDCPKSHVSPAQKTDPKGLNVAQYAQKPKGKPAAAPSAPSPAVAAAAAPSQQIQPLNPGAKPCMFGSACTRPGCFFSHPPTPANSGGSGTNLTPCRFGLACTRPDCHFSHPPGHRRGGGSPAGASSSTPNKGQNQRNLSATFSGTSASSNGNGISPAGIEGKDNVKIDDSKMSARMKKFMDPENNGGERILPGSGLAENSSNKGQDQDGSSEKRDSLEVVI